MSGHHFSSPQMFALCMFADSLSGFLVSAGSGVITLGLPDSPGVPKVREEDMEEEIERLDGAIKSNRALQCVVLRRQERK